MPARFQLEQNYPNPFNPSTTIIYQIPNKSLVILQVYDVLGRKMKTLMEEVQNVGTHSVVFDAGELSSGFYVYRLSAGGFIGTKKLMIIK